MSLSDASRFNISAKDLGAYPWQELVASHPTKECWSFYQVFTKAARECQHSGDDLGERVFSFLSVVASFHATPDSRTSPYQLHVAKI
ncbi:MAG: hypothetical protein EOP84_09605 [Verrucomicrobiaceae bacterium]|nr:MAG: hypothetical protein EOP84_09605 [Verrucomicrobiaceae bacterium]